MPPRYTQGDLFEAPGNGGGPGVQRPRKPRPSDTAPYSLVSFPDPYAHPELAEAKWLPFWKSLPKTAQPQLALGLRSKTTRRIVSILRVFHRTMTSPWLSIDALAFGGVFTSADHRGHGGASTLLRRALGLAALQTPLVLLISKSPRPLYLRAGFQPLNVLPFGMNRVYAAPLVNGLHLDRTHGWLLTPNEGF